MDFTSLSFCGRLVEDPQVKTSENGNTVCRFSVASNERIGKTGEERTTYIPTVVFGREAEICGQYLTKGREVLVQGKLETDTYVDKEGVSRKTFSCVVGIGGSVRFGKGGAKVEEAPEEPVKDARKAMSTAKSLINRNMGRNRPR
jgi:single-strand DNA-binding protein